MSSLAFDCPRGGGALCSPRATARISFSSSFSVFIAVLHFAVSQQVFVDDLESNPVSLARGPHGREKVRDKAVGIREPIRDAPIGIAERVTVIVFDLPRDTLCIVVAEEPPPIDVVQRKRVFDAVWPAFACLDRRR